MKHLHRSSWPSWREFVVSLSIWIPLGLLLMALDVIQVVDGGRSAPAWSSRIVVEVLAQLGPFAFATPFLVATARHLARTSPSRRAYWVSSLRAVLIFAALHAVLVHVRFGHPANFSGVAYLARNTFFYALNYGAILALALSLEQERVGRARKQDLVTAQLRALRAQLQPHFLFNTLHAIAVTARTDAEATVRMLTLLGDMLRQTLKERSGDLVSLAEERMLLQPYLELQRLRFPDRLRFDVDLPTDVLGGAVPDLLLQPVVENALQHGIEQRPEGGNLHIRARRVDGTLEILVADDGPGVSGRSDELRLGIGLGATKARLHALFGDAASVDVAPNPNGGTTVTLRMPWLEVTRAA